MVNSNSPNFQKGNLILIGGAEDKRRSKYILRNILEIYNVKNAILIPTASSYPSDVGRNYKYAFRSLGLKNLEIFDIRNKNEIDKPEHLKKLEEADLVFFSGGDQVKLVDVFDGSKILEVIKTKFKNKEINIAGTSAGASASGEMMIYDGDYKGFEKDKIFFHKGFGFLKNIIIDTHFIERCRMPRLTQSLLKDNLKKGFGISENTAIFISPDLKFQVLGCGTVTLIDSENAQKSNFKEIEMYEKFSVNNLKFAFLSDETTFDINKWEIIENKKTIKKKIC